MGDLGSLKKDALTLRDRAPAQELDHGGVLEENSGCAHFG